MSLGYLERAFYEFFDRHNFCIPAVIVSVRSAAQRRIDVKPLPNKVYATGEVIEYPVITSVQAVMPSTSNTMIHFPLVVGDVVLLVFSQEELDSAKAGSTAPYTPDTRRKLDLSDAIAIVGYFGFGNTPEGKTMRHCNYTDADVAIVHNIGSPDETSFVLKSNGSMELDANAYTFKRGRASFVGIDTNSIKDGNGREYVGHKHQYYDDGTPKLTSENL